MKEKDIAFRTKLFEILMLMATLLVVLNFTNLNPNLTGKNLQTFVDYNKVLFAVFIVAGLVYYILIDKKMDEDKLGKFSKFNLGLIFLSTVAFSFCFGGLIGILVGSSSHITIYSVIYTVVVGILLIIVLLPQKILMKAKISLRYIVNLLDC